MFAIPALRQHPNNHGHTLVLPVRHTRNPADASPPVRNEIFAMAAQLTSAALSLFGADGSIVFQNNIAADDRFFHRHVHVVPRFPNDQFVMTRAAVAEVPGPNVASRRFGSARHSRHDEKLWPGRRSPKVPCYYRGNARNAPRPAGQLTSFRDRKSRGSCSAAGGRARARKPGPTARGP